MPMELDNNIIETMRLETVLGLIDNISREKGFSVKYLIEFFYESYPSFNSYINPKNQIFDSETVYNILNSFQNIPADVETP